MELPARITSCGPGVFYWAALIRSGALRRRTFWDTFPNVITPHDTLGGGLGRWWPRLIQWQRRLESGGLGGDQLLGQTRHDIQTVHIYPLEAGHLLVLAADRAGGWYAGRFETSTGAPVGQPWRAMPIPVAGDGDRLRITQALVTPWGGDHLIWLGTSRHSLWTVPLGALLSSSGGASEHDTYSWHRRRC